MDAEEFEEGEFLKKKIAVKLLSGQACATRNGMRGFACNKKDDLVNKLRPLMPENRQIVFKHLDLIDNL